MIDQFGMSGGMGQPRSVTRQVASVVSRRQKALNLGAENSALRTLTLSQINQLTPEAQEALRQIRVTTGEPVGGSYYDRVSRTINLSPGALYTQAAFHEAQHALGMPSGFSITPEQRSRAERAYGLTWWDVKNAGSFLGTIKRFSQYVGIGGGGSRQEAYATLAQGGAYNIDPSLRQYYPQFTQAAFVPPPRPPVPVSLQSLAMRQWSYSHGR